MNKLFFFKCLIFLFLSQSCFADVTSITNSGTGTFTTDTSTTGYGQVSSAGVASTINAEIELDFDLLASFALAICGEGTTTFPANSVFNNSQAATFIKSSKFTYTDSNAEKLIQTTDEIGHPIIPDFEINGILSNFPRSQAVNILITPLSGGTCSGCINLESIAGDSIKVLLYGFAGGQDIDGTVNSVQFISNTNGLELSQSLNSVNFNIAGFAPLRIFGDIDESTVTMDDEPNSFSGTLQILLTKL